MSIESERQSDFFDICGQCKTNCCKNARPPIIVKRKQIIEAYLKKEKSPIDNPFVQTAYTFPKEDAEGYCVFYNKKTGRCLVHSVKPETCVAGPITFDINVKYQKIEWYLKSEKICRLAGRLYKNEEALREHLKSAKREILRLVRALDSDALEVILRIEEPETIKIDEDNVVSSILGKLNNNGSRDSV